MQLRVGDSMVSNKLLKQLWTVAPRVFDSGRRPVGAGLPRELSGTGSKIRQLGESGIYPSQGSLTLRARSSARWSATPPNSHALRAEASRHLWVCGRKPSPSTAPKKILYFADTFSPVVR